MDNLEKQDEDLYINLFVTAINTKNVTLVKKLLNNNKSRKDVVLEIYNKNLLTFEKLQFIIDKCADLLNISSSLIRILFRNDDFKLLDIIFNKYKFYDNEFIMNLLLCYNNRKPVSNSDLYRQISNEKYKIFVNRKILEENYYCEKKTNLYLKSACLAGNEYLVKYLCNHGACINEMYSNENSPLYYACKNNGNGNAAIVKYLVERGADINRENRNDETPLYIVCQNGNKTIAEYLVDRY